MAFIPNTESEQQKMLEKIGVSSFEELITAIPEEIRLKQPLNLMNRLSEMEVTKL